MPKDLWKVIHNEFNLIWKGTLPLVFLYIREFEINAASNKRI